MSPESTMTHRFMQVNGIQMHIAEAGTGPLVVLLHGFPETGRSWRHQMAALADAGYHTVAPDLRGYGQTDAPPAIESYTVLHLVGDIVGLLNALEAPSAAIVGHDWGAIIAWHVALLRPDRVRALSTLSAPYVPRGLAYGPRSAIPPTTIARQMIGDHFFYQLYFLEPGRAEAEMERDIRQTLRMIAGGPLWRCDGRRAVAPHSPRTRCYAPHRPHTIRDPTGVADRSRSRCPD